MKEKITFLKFLFGLIVIAALPGLLIVQDETVMVFAPLYVCVMLPLVILAAWSTAHSKLPPKSLLLRLVVLATISAPFFIFAVYPFSKTNIALVLLTIGFGLTLPLWNRYLTWWFYTIGGRFPLPRYHNWLLGKKNYKGNGKEYGAFVQQAAGGAASIGLLGVFLTRQWQISSILLLFQTLSFLLLFGLSLTFGADIKRKLLGKS